MSRPLRDTDPQKVHLITARTARAELLLVPHPKLNELVGGIIARYAELFEIEIFAYCVLSNHYHLLARAPFENLSRFAECINKEIAKRVNKYVSREGAFWGRRYDDQIAIEEVDALDGLLYVVTNPVKHGLVSNPKDWPGLTCYWQLQDEKPRSYYFFLYTEYRKALKRSLATGDPLVRSDYEILHQLKLKPLPILSGLSRRQRSKKLSELISKRTAYWVRERKENNLGFLGRKKILNQPKKGKFPKEVSRSNRPSCYSSSAEAKAKFRADEFTRVEAYRQASMRYRSGEPDVVFPMHTIKPPMHHNPCQSIACFAPP